VKMQSLFLLNYYINLVEPPNRKRYVHISSGHPLITKKKSTTLTSYFYKKLLKTSIYTFVKVICKTNLFM
jgi:hypothetical protein